ncbi:MAG TPA: hypothetical protein VLS51_01665 [Propionibacteriaceae bacterium]|nr:hypothetical protein [Propionibacteriaceae bacterium]
MTESYESTGARRAVALEDEEDVTTFPGAVGWTIAGTVLPGLGFLKARRWPEGIVTLLFFLTLVGGVGYLAYQRTFLTLLTSSPITLTGLAVLCALLGLMITGIILGTYLALRPHVVTSRQRVWGGLLVVVLTFIVLTPLAVAIGASLSRAGLVR